ncbi:BrnA antitoxin family protein [Sphingomonas sp. MMSM20]|uniref:BrnA antitoxin family protein n=1 Tax=Sphingomonas lycopersici TaxID=2951807 RepID=UPI002237A75E|nr:BrnA antitoxin family protein [Sphingomonas lycopersici]MCW6529561.1 BrnA antitoxin family protein [Sphingomonas lycopersici]
MAKNASTIALEADPNDPEDFDVSESGIEQALVARRKRVGRPRGSNKEPVTIRLDREVLERFKATGPGWQARINDVLRKASAQLSG